MSGPRRVESFTKFPDALLPHLVWLRNARLAVYLVVRSRTKYTSSWRGWTLHQLAQLAAVKRSTAHQAISELARPAPEALPEDVAGLVYVRVSFRQPRVGNVVELLEPPARLHPTLWDEAGGPARLFEPRAHAVENVWKGGAEGEDGPANRPADRTSRPADRTSRPACRTLTSGNRRR